MGPRSSTLQVGRPTLFRPFTSVSTPAQDTKTPDFEFQIPRQDDQLVLLSESRWPSTRFVFVFLDPARLVGPTLEAVALTLLVGPNASGNPLLAVVKVDPNDDQSVCTGADWLDLDPTNDRLTDATYVDLAHGRDYADVAPLKGVIFADAGEGVMEVAVDMIRVDRG